MTIWVTSLCVILWVKKGRQFFQTSEEIWDNLVKNSTHKSNFSIWGTYTSDMVFSKSTIKKDDQLLKITKSKRRSRKEFRASLFEEQMTEKNLRKMILKFQKKKLKI